MDQFKNRLTKTVLGQTLIYTFFETPLLNNVYNIII